MSTRLLCLTVAIAACVSTLPAAAESPSGALKVALLPIVVLSADDSSSYLSDGLASMLSARLERTGGVDVTRLRGGKATTQPDEAIAAGVDAGADYVVFGSFTQFGAGASLDIHCAPVDGSDERARRVFIQSGSLGDIIPKLDQLAAKMERYLLSDVPASPAVAESNGSGLSYDELMDRVEALEAAVFLPDIDAASVDASPASTPESDPEGAAAESNGS